MFYEYLVMTSVCCKVGMHAAKCNDTPRSDIQSATKGQCGRRTVHIICPWTGFSALKQAPLDTLTEAFTASAEAAQGIPGETTSFVRAYASLLVEGIDDNSSVSAGQVNDYQARHAGEKTADAVAPTRR